MKGSLIYKILNLIKNKSLGTVDFIESIMEAGYGASLGKIEYINNKKEETRLIDKIKKEKLRNLKKYIYKLKKQGLVSEDKSQKIILSTKGKEKLFSLKEINRTDKDKYKKEVSDEVIIISYDIPIAYNKERHILRDILKRLGFNLIHKSVWVGKVKLPKEFIIDLNKLNIIDYIEILKVTKNGSLKSFE